MRIIDKNIFTQERGMFRPKGSSPSAGSGQGVEWQDIPKEQGEKQVLSDNQILELSELILKIENYYDMPQDIEFAYEQGKFYIVQSRPITTLN